MRNVTISIERMQKKEGNKYGSWLHAFPQFLCAAPFPGDKTQYSKRDKLGFRRWVVTKPTHSVETRFQPDMVGSKGVTRSNSLFSQSESYSTEIHVLLSQCVGGRSLPANILSTIQIRRVDGKIGLIILVPRAVKGRLVRQGLFALLSFTALAWAPSPQSAQLLV